MVLSKLRIKLKTYGPHEGEYAGTAEFTDEAGNIALHLTPEMCDRIFVICADGVLSIAKEAAANLTCRVIEHREKLEGT